MADDDRGRRELRDAASDPEQDHAAHRALDALNSGFKSLEESMQISEVWYHELGHRERDSTGPIAEVAGDLFNAMSLLGGTAAALVNGATSLIADGNLYAAAALNRQLVEIEYLAWAFENDLEEVGYWHRSTEDERRKRWQPRHLRQRSRGQFRGKDYALHCEFGGHPTPEGMRNLLYGDPVLMTAIHRFETSTTGTVRGAMRLPPCRGCATDTGSMRNWLDQLL